MSPPAQARRRRSRCVLFQLNWSQPCLPVLAWVKNRCFRWWWTEGIVFCDLSSVLSVSGYHRLFLRLSKSDIRSAFLLVCSCFQCVNGRTLNYCWPFTHWIAAAVCLDKGRSSFQRMNGHCPATLNDHFPLVCDWIGRFDLFVWSIIKLVAVSMWFFNHHMWVVFWRFFRLSLVIALFCLCITIRQLFRWYWNIG